MPEVKQRHRARGVMGAKIIFNDRAVLDCVVANISSSGAELALADAREIPNEFELHIPSKWCSHRARLVWRDADGIGVVFYPDSKKRH
jgi:hypothetical protein